MLTMTLKIHTFNKLLIFSHNAMPPARGLMCRLRRTHQSVLDGIL